MQRAERAMGILDGFVQRSQTGRPPRVIARGGGDFAPARTQAALTSPPRSPERRAVSPPRSPQRLLPQQWRDVSPLGARRLPASQEAWQEQRRGRSPPRSGSPFGSRGAGPGALQTSDDDRMRLQRQGLSQLADADRHAKNGMRVHAHASALCQCSPPNEHARVSTQARISVTVVVRILQAIWRQRSGP